MRDTLDITDTTPRRFDVGIEALVEGEPVLFQACRFWRSGEKLAVSAFSNWAPDSANPTQAREAIARAREAVSRLAELSAEFAGLLRDVELEFHFVYDYGGGSIALAEEVAGRFEWLARE